MFLTGADVLVGREVRVNGQVAGCAPPSGGHARRAAPLASGDDVTVTVRLRSLDGTVLAADILAPPGASRGAVLVHGGGVDRHEGGFFDRLADGLAREGVASLRLDLRGHGESEGTREELTLGGIGNDVRAAIGALSSRTAIERISVLGASFSGGVCASVPARHKDLVERLVLFNPLLDYKKRFVEEKDYWHDDYIDTTGAELLRANGYVEHSPTFPLGRALLNEVFWWDSRADLPKISAPTLVVHGTDDTFISIDSSREAIRTLTCTSELLELEGAQHGIAVHDDPEYKQPQTRQWQSEVITAAARWLTA